LFKGISLVLTKLCIQRKLVGFPDNRISFCAMLAQFACSCFKQDTINWNTRTAKW